jgi:hypothetical protein
MKNQPRQQPIPALTPRETRGALLGVLRAHKFYIVFTILWNILCLPITVMVGLGLLGEDQGGFLCFLGFMSLFLLVGFWLFWSTMGKIIRDRWLLTYGVLTQGEVVEHSQESTASQNGQRATRIIWTFEDALGQVHRGELESFDRGMISSHKPGTAVDVLFDPSDPERSVVPSLMRASFGPVAQVEDARVALDRDAPGVAQAPAPWSGQSRLTLLALPRRARGGCLGPRSSAGAGVGYLKVSPEEIAQVDTHGEVSASVRWEEPFTVQLTAWSLPRGEVELGVTLVQRGGQGRLRFQVELPQSAVDRGVVVQQLKAPYLHANDLRRLWPALRFYLQARGEDVTGQLSLP